MFEAREDLSDCRILITNDDGIHAPGLEVLERIARELSDDVWVCAPETEQSGASHSLTLHRPLRVRQIDDRRFSVDGTPTDCVLLAINRLLEDKRPTLVLSGVNHGSNLGEDVTYSGTIAAAMEATLLGVPAIALSQHMAEWSDVPWAATEYWATRVIRHVTQIPWPRNVLMNVNFPSVPGDEVVGIRTVRHGKRKIGDDLTERIDPRGRAYYWIGTLRGGEDVGDDTDIAAILRGEISVTPLCLDLTHQPTLESLRHVFR